MEREEGQELGVRMVHLEYSWEEAAPTAEASAALWADEGIETAAENPREEEGEEPLDAAGAAGPVAEEDGAPVEEGAFDAAGAAGPVAAEDNEGFDMEGTVGPDIVEDWGDEEITPRNMIQIYDYYNGIHPHLARMAQVSFFLPRLEGAERETRRLQTALEVNRRAGRTTYLYNRALETTFRLCDDFAWAEWRSFTKVGDEVPETLQQWTESLHRTPDLTDPAEADGETFRDIICRLQENNDRLQASVELARESKDRAHHGYAMERGRRLQAETERDAALDEQQECRCQRAENPQGGGPGGDTL